MDVMSRPDRAIFRLPAAALFLPVLLFFCITPLATAGGAVGRCCSRSRWRIGVGAHHPHNGHGDRVTAHGLLGAKRMAWADMDRLEFKDSRWAIAVGTDGRRLRLPMVRPRDLPAAAAVAGGSCYWARGVVR